MGVELLARLQHHRVPAALRIGDLHLVANGERASPHGGRHGPKVIGRGFAVRRLVVRYRCSAAATSDAVSTPSRLPSGSTTRYSAAGISCNCFSNSSPARCAGTKSAAATPLDIEPVLIQGRRSSGVAVTAASLTTPVGRP